MFCLSFFGVVVLPSYLSSILRTTVAATPRPRCRSRSVVERPAGKPRAVAVAAIARVDAAVRAPTVVVASIVAAGRPSVVFVAILRIATVTADSVVPATPRTARPVAAVGAVAVLPAQPHPPADRVVLP